jgi:hypothetical protein
MSESEYLYTVIGRLARVYDALSKSELVGDAEWLQAQHQFRHKRRDASLFVFLKGVRLTSLLRAGLVLLSEGHANEMGILVRCMDETLEDMMLFLREQGKDASIDKAQERALQEFFQEEFEDASAGLPVSAKRDRVSRSKVRAAIAGMRPGGVNPHDHAQIAGTIYSTFSGYLHGAYPHIMELYGGVPPFKYHMMGMSRTPRAAEMLRQLAIQTYHGVLGALLVTKRLGEAAAAQYVLSMREEMEKRYPGIAPDPEPLIASMKAGKKVRSD